MIGIGLWIEWGRATAPLLNATDSVQYRCLYAVQQLLQGASWPLVHDPDGGADIALSIDDIVVKKLPLERIYKRVDNPVNLPCIIITPARVQAPPTQGVNTADDYFKPTLVTMAMKDNAEPTLQLNLDVMSLWQQIVSRGFQNQRLSGVSEVLICHVEPAEAIIPAAWGSNVLASAVLLKFISREPRGF